MNDKVYAVIKTNQYGDVRIFYYGDAQRALDCYRAEKNNPTVIRLRLVAGEVDNVEFMNNVLYWNRDGVEVSY